MGTDSQLSDYCLVLQKMLSEKTSDKKLFKAIVNAPFHNKLHTTNLDLGIVVLLLVDNSESTINRIAYSDTEPARWAVKKTPVAFHDIKIPKDHKLNVIAKAIKLNQPQKTSDWRYLFTPVLAAETARFNQAEAGMGCSYVYPLKNARDGAALIFSFYQPMNQINSKHRNFMKSYSKMVTDALNQ